MQLTAEIAERIEGVDFDDGIIRRQMLAKSVIWESWGRMMLDHGVCKTSDPGESRCASPQRRNVDLEQTLLDLRTVQAQLVQSEKMGSLGQLVAGIAHEINNAINAAYNGIFPLRHKAQILQTLVAAALDGRTHVDENLRKRIDDSFDSIFELSEIVEHGAARTARIVRDLKTFSHPGSEPSNAFDVHDTLDVCLNLLAGQLRHRIRVVRDYQANGCFRGPSGQLGQVFMNLLTNAEQAIRGEGEIRVSTCTAGDRLTVAIRDTGVGIPKQDRSRIFDPFFTTKPPGVGTGLGLSISDSIVRKLGGLISFDSQPGAGTEFTVSLPCEVDSSSEPTGDGPAADAQAAAGSGSRQSTPHDGPMQGVLA